MTNGGTILVLAAGTATNGPDGMSFTISGDNYLMGFDLNGGQGTLHSACACPDLASDGPGVAHSLDGDAAHGGRTLRRLVHQSDRRRQAGDEAGGVSQCTPGKRPKSLSNSASTSIAWSRSWLATPRWNAGSV